MKLMEKKIHGALRNPRCSGSFLVRRQQEHVFFGQELAKGHQHFTAPIGDNLGGISANDFLNSSVIFFLVVLEIRQKRGEGYLED